MTAPLKEVSDPEAVEGPAELVRTRDKARWIACLNAPQPVQGDLLCLHAFDLELARAREVTSQPLLAEIRLAWWQETVDQIYAGLAPRSHEVVRPLADVIRRYDLPKPTIDRLIAARMDDTEEAAPPSLSELASAASAIGAPVIELAALILGCPDVAEAARLAGRAVGLTAVVRAIPFDLARGRLRLPIDVLAQGNLNPARVIAGRDREGLRAAGMGLLALARQAMDDARACSVPRAARPAFYHAVLAEGEAMWLEQDRPGPYPEYRMIARLAWRRMLGRI